MNTQRVPAPETMTQEAPYPTDLANLVEALSYRKGWTFSLAYRDRGQGSKGLTFTAVGTYPDTYNPETLIRIAHQFIVPAASFNAQSWRHWLLECIFDIERHEACEFFQVFGERPYAPQHGPGNDPYIVFEHGDDLQRRTRFDGTVAPS